MNSSCLNLKLPFIIQEGIVEEETNRAETEAFFYGCTGMIFQIVFSVVPLRGQRLDEGVAGSPCMPGDRMTVIDSFFGPFLAALYAGLGEQSSFGFVREPYNMKEEG